MSFVVAREIRPHDEEILNDKAEAFITRHGIDLAYVRGLLGPHNSLYEGLCRYVDGEEATGDPRLARLWGAIVARVAGHRRATGIAYGNFGHTARH